MKMHKANEVAQKLMEWVSMSTYLMEMSLSIRNKGQNSRSKFKYSVVRIYKHVWVSS